VTHTVMRLLARCLLMIGCLMAAAIPSSAGADTDPPAPPLVEIKRQANDAAARYSRAEAHHERLGAEVKGLEGQVSILEQRMGALRQAATRGAAVLYMRDAVVDSDWGLGDGDAVLRSAHRMKLMGEVNTLAGDALQTLDDAARRLRAQRRSLDDRRHQQDQVLAQLGGERRDVERRLAAMAKAERELRSRLVAAARAKPRTSRAEPSVDRALMAGLPDNFICPIDGPVAFSDDWGGGRNHKGNDLMSPRGTPNVAVVAGTIESRQWGGGGLTIFLTGDDGNTYVYMHLLNVVGPAPRHVEQREVIGLVGASGNATAYHTHFEFHPGGGPAVDPHPLIAAHC
jgi:murein DD-endopeptidase MepM/ murein hydrolase activator NlpD